MGLMKPMSLQVTKVYHVYHGVSFCILVKNYLKVTIILAGTKFSGFAK